jgi:hypothetical protein
MQQLLFRTTTGYLILCSTGCDSGFPQTDTTQWSDVVAFQTGPNLDQAFVQIFPAPFSDDFLTMVLPCVTPPLPGCVLPDGTRPDVMTQYRTKQAEVTIYFGSTTPKGFLNTVGGPLGGFGGNIFNIISAAAPEPETWNLLVLGLTVFALARGLWLDHQQRYAKRAPPEPSASCDLR